MGCDLTTTSSAIPKYQTVRSEGRCPSFPFSSPLPLFRISTCKLSSIPTFGFPYLLPSSVSCKSCSCHSYENCRGVYQQFLFSCAPNAGKGNSKLCARQPAVNPLASWPQPFLTLFALCALFV